MQKGNPEDIKDENVKSDLELDPDSGCTPTAAKLLCIDSTQQIQDRRRWSKYITNIIAKSVFTSDEKPRKYIRKTCCNSGRSVLQG